MSPAKAKAKTNGAGNREQRRYVRSRHMTTNFEDGGEFDGLVVRTKRVTVDELLDFVGQAGDLPVNVTTMDDEQIAATKELLAQFADKLVSWNLDEPVLDDDGEETDESTPVEATYEGLMSQDFGLVFTLFMTWMSAIGDVAGPLGATSPSGSPSAVPSLPMDELSPNPPS